MLITYFSTFGGFAAMNVALTEYINSVLKIEKSWIKQVVSWVCPILLSVVGFLFGFGFFASYGTITSVSGWILTALTGFGIGLTSNGIYDIDIVQSMINYVKNAPKLKLNK